MSEELIAIGTHRARLRTFQLGKTKKGEPQAVCRFEIVKGQDSGRFITWFGSLSSAPNSKDIPFRNFTIESLTHCGWKPDKQGIDQLPALVDEGALAEEVDLVVEHDNYQGTVSARVKYVNKAGGGKLALKSELSSTEAAALAAELRRDIAGLGGAQNGTAGKTKSRVEKDDIPF